MQSEQYIQATAVSRFFSSSLIRDLAKRGKSPLLARLVAESGLDSTLNPEDTIEMVFEHAFHYLKQKSFRHEYAYKAALTHKVLLGIHSLRTASMLTEFRVGDCKADVVILNGTGSVYEIKSERDTLSRLEKQISAYRTVFAKVNVIVGDNHVDEVLKRLPCDVGIMTLGKRYRISTLREAIDNPSRTNSSAIFSSITSKEAELIMKSLGIEIPSVPNTQRFSAYKEVFETIPPDVAHKEMVKTLKRTRKLTDLEPYIDNLPAALQAVALSSKLNIKQLTNLIETLKTPVETARKWAL
ncbi:hypothetical protein D1821_06030 [Phaeobacter inhibens]|nr:hypothetical protein PGA2_c11680 [Phaeobacter inhibens 2.10]AXT41980.1 hypothetical protein D1821_06030 [Phaeobacter inhibens]